MNTLFQAVAAAFMAISFATLIWPLNVPVAAGAYKIYHGGKPPPFEPKEFWVRSALTALGLAVLTAVFLFVLYLLVGEFELKEVQGEIEVSLFVIYLPAGIVYVFWMYALEDMMEATGVFFLYVLLPGLPFLLIYWLAHLGTKLSAAIPWLVAF